MLKSRIILVVSLFLASTAFLFAQGGYGGWCDPDSLKLVTVNGYAIVDTTIEMHLHVLYR